MHSETISWAQRSSSEASTIVGATTTKQLEESLAAADVVLDAETLERIDQVEEESPNSFGEDGLRRL